MCVADFKCDGKAELITKTADGSKDGKGKTISDGSKNCRTSTGTILTGAEYLTLFDGQTGAALDTIDFPVPRGEATGKTAKNTWGDDKGAEFWGAADGNVYDSAGKKISGTRPAQNFFIYWDGDLEREILDGTKIYKMTAADSVKGIFTATGCASNNSSKSVTMHDS